MSLLGALLRNESGGRNIANTTQGTSSGQAQGYFQITTGTWGEFGGYQYAPTPLQATYAQQAAVASNIPLSRWDNSTIAAMQSTGLSVNRSQTLGQNLANNGESFSDFNPDGTAGTIAIGPHDSASGANTGMTGGNYIAMNPSDPNFGDITGLPVAGVNAPAGSTGSGSGVGNDQGTPNLGGGVSQGASPSTPGSQPGTMEGQVQQPVSVGIQPGLWSDIQTEINKVTTASGQGVQSAIKAAESGVANWLGQSMNWFTRAFLIVLGIVIVAVALAHLMAPNSPIAQATRLPRAA